MRPASAPAQTVLACTRGHLHWGHDSLAACHLLGAGADRLVVTAAAAPGVRAVAGRRAVSLAGAGVADTACIHLAAEFAGRRVGEMALSLMPGWAVGAIGIRSRWRRPALGAGIVRRRQC